MKKYFKIICITSMLLLSTNIFAQDEDDPDAPPGDPGQAPIDDYIPLLIVGATVLAFRLLPKAAKKQA